ncbi:MAG: nitrilase-related carbon-nitrogen hydrolase, partial [Nitrososphaera sp.]
MKKIAVVQMQSSEDKQENLKKSIDFINEAASKNAQLVCFPEFQMAFSPSNRSANHLS